MGLTFDDETIRDYERLDARLESLIGAIGGCLDAAMRYVDRPPYRLREESADFTAEDYAPDANPTATILYELKRDLIDRITEAETAIRKDMMAPTRAAIGPGREGDWCA